MIRVGITGIGFMGMIHYLAYQNVPGVEVVAFCEKYNKERLNGDWTSIKGNFGPQGTMMDMSKFARYTELEDLIADPNVDMVDICLPPNQHCDATIACLKGGKHVFCEKPIALKSEEGKAMAQTAEETGKMLNIGHVLPFFPQFRFLIEARESGKWGKLLGGNFSRVISDPQWLPKFFDMDVVGGPMLDLHIHDAHFIRYFFGMPKAVQGVGRCRGNVPEYFNVQYLYDDPDYTVTATSGIIKQQGRPFTFGFEVHFEKATVLTECFNETPLTVLHEDGTVERPELPGGSDTLPFENEIAEVVRCVSSGEKSSLLDGQLASDAVSLCHKEIEAIVSKRPVSIS
ncbi:MAG: Gfo/Idh/MocA family oxidoreductase [Planctomycetia bacterium]|nr:Gfo/Idh/MocA family oxidoreductase [Planctomycetia bacterium]